MTTKDIQPLESKIALAVRELREENEQLRARIDGLCEAMAEADMLISDGTPNLAHSILRDAWIENEGT